MASRRSVALQPVHGSVPPPSEGSWQTGGAPKSDSPAQPLSPRRDFLKAHDARPARKTVHLTPLPLQLQTGTEMADSVALPPLPDTPKAPNLSDDEIEGEICIEILQFERYEVIDLSEAGPLASPRGWQSAEPSPSRPRE